MISVIKKTIIVLAVASFVLPLPAQQNGAQDEKKEEKSGFNGLQWGSSPAVVKGKIPDKIKFTDDKKIIITEEDNISRTYGFFYREPDAAAESGSVNEGSLYYVSVRFPLLRMEDVEVKIQEKHGGPTGKNISPSGGAVVWDRNGTLIIMWVNRIESRLYSGRVVYIGKELSSRVRDYKKEIFSKTEMEVIEKLNL